MSDVGTRPRSAWIGVQHRAGWGFSDETLLSRTFCGDISPFKLPPR